MITLEEFNRRIPRPLPYYFYDQNEKKWVVQYKNSRFITDDETLAERVRDVLEEEFLYRR